MNLDIIKETYRQHLKDTYLEGRNDAFDNLIKAFDGVPKELRNEPLKIDDIIAFLKKAKERKYESDNKFHN